jgi:hypothetical protein
LAEIRILTADDILRAEDLPRELVEVPEWGGAVYVRGLTAWERSEFENEMFDLKSKRIKPGKKGRKAAEEDVDMKIDMKLMRVRLPAMCMVNEQGDRLFSDDRVEKLGRKHPGVLDRISAVARRLSGMEPDEDEVGED